MILSIITVTLNCVDTIERTIKSVISQKNKDIEYIIIDGGSTDGTLDIIKKYSHLIDYCISEEDEGIYDAMNKGIAVAHGKWINFMNGNDWFAVGALNNVVGSLRDKKPQLLYGIVRMADGKNTGKPIGAHNLKSDYDKNVIHFGNIYCHQGLFVDKELFDKVGLYNKKYRIISDFEWLLKAHNMGIDPFVSDVEVGYFSEGGISSKDYEHDECLELMVNSFKQDEKLSGILEYKRKQYAFNLFCINNSSYVYEFLNKYKQLFMWGTGNRGDELYDTIKKTGITITGVINSDYVDNMWNGTKIFHYSELLPELEFSDNYLILISTEKYETEILEILSRYRIKKENYITLSMLYELPTKTPMVF